MFFFVLMDLKVSQELKFVGASAWRYSLNSLIGQPFVTRQQVDNAAIGETMFQEIVLHNLIVSMRINANISVARQAEVHDTINHGVFD